MALEIEQSGLVSEPQIEQLSGEKRRFRRVPLALLGRFMRANKQEYPCKLVDISVAGMALMSPVGVDDDELIIVYLDILGGLEGRVARQFDGGFALALNITPHKREKLAAQITWLINRHELLPSDARRHERVVPRNGEQTLQVGDGEPVNCTVIDVSVSGASIATHLRPAIGDDVMLGKLRCRVVRQHEKGIAVRFVDIQQPTALRRYFG